MPSPEIELAVREPSIVIVPLFVTSDAVNEEPAIVILPSFTTAALSVFTPANASEPLLYTVSVAVARTMFSSFMFPAFQTAPPALAVLPPNVQPLTVTTPVEFASFKIAPPCSVVSPPFAVNTQPLTVSAADAHVCEIAPP